MLLRFLRLCFLLGVTFVCGESLAAVSAVRVPASDRRAIEQVVRAQMDALRRDDAREAFSYATREVQEMFESAEDFLDTVKDSYAPVYRPQAVEFLPLQRIEGKIVQVVQVTASDGRIWLAAYEMQRQRGHVWKINGCELHQTTGTLA